MTIECGPFPRARGRECFDEGALRPWPGHAGANPLRARDGPVTNGPSQRWQAFPGTAWLHRADRRRLARHLAGPLGRLAARARDRGMAGGVDIHHDGLHADSMGHCGLRSPRPERARRNHSRAGPALRSPITRVPGHRRRRAPARGLGCTAARRGCLRRRRLTARVKPARGRLSPLPLNLPTLRGRYRRTGAVVVAGCAEHTRSRHAPRTPEPPGTPGHSPTGTSEWCRRYSCRTPRGRTRCTSPSRGTESRSGTRCPCRGTTANHRPG